MKKQLLSISVTSLLRRLLTEGELSIHQGNDVLNKIITLITGGVDLASEN